MWNEPPREYLALIPRLYETEDVAVEHKLIYLHFFVAGCDWYISEYDESEDLFWGFVVLNNDYINSEWGYVSFKELREININGIEVDCETPWKICKSSEIEKICLAHGWKGNQRVEVGDRSEGRIVG